jgi:hypothetical protein
LGRNLRDGALRKVRARRAHRANAPFSPLERARARSTNARAQSLGSAIARLAAAFATARQLPFAAAMKTFTKISLLGLVSLLGTSAVACAAPAGEDVEDQSSALGRDAINASKGKGLNVLDPDNTWSTNISSDELYGALLLVLGGSRLVIDTTETSPTIPSDPFYHCTYPNQQAREAGQQECFAMAGAARSQCLRMLNEEFPNIKECNWTTGPKHSYIDFGPLAESYGAKDTPFDITEIKRDTWGPGGITVGINYVRTTVGPQTIAAEWTNEANVPAGSVTLKLESNQPTLPCAHWEVYLGCPDLELTDMKVNAKLTNIAPTPDKKQLGYGDVVATFSFDRNLNNIPDSFLTVFVDVDQIIRNNVQKQVKKALEKEQSRTALNKALTALAEQSAKKNHAQWNGFKELTGTSFYNGGLVVSYVPN